MDVLILEGLAFLQPVTALLSHSFITA
jgi:hypothetical protein